MKKLTVAALATAALAFTALPAQADPIEVGRLSCDIDGGIGYLIGSSKDMVCTFHRKGHGSETYTGTIRKLGLDIGVTNETRLEWLVFAAEKEHITEGTLSGTYVGGSGEASFGVGLGANWLVGGFRNSIALQPWSVQASTGVNLTWALSGLTLD